jgi:ligand-binding SRPBCC domain-containing protein
VSSYHFLQVQQFPVSLERLWEFFMHPANLQQITDDKYKFTVLSRQEDIETMRQGLLINYKLSPFLGIYYNWITEITELEDKDYFIDVQKEGPYKKWIHKHSFKAIEGGVEMRDELSYEMPYGIIGKLAYALFIRKQVGEIFRFRYKKLEGVFGKMSRGS